MNHSTKINDTDFIYNRRAWPYGGFDGHVKIIRGKDSMNVPVKDLKEFVAEIFRDELISLVESMSADDVLEIAMGSVMERARRGQ